MVRVEPTRDTAFTGLNQVANCCGSMFYSIMRRQLSQTAMCLSFSIRYFLGKYWVCFYLSAGAKVA